MKKLISIVLIIAMIAVSVCISAAPIYAVSYVSDENFDYAVVDDDSYMLFRYKGNSDNPVLPSQYNGKSIVGIMGYCFKDSTISSVTIPNSYSTIGELAFYGCNGLTEVSIPSGVTTLEDMAFARCSSLRKLDLSASSVTSLPYSLCYGDSALEEVVFSDKINNIGESAFEKTGLTSVELGKNVKKIGESTFSDCENLESVNLPKGLTKIGEKAFYGDSALEKLYIPGTVSNIGIDAFAPMSYSSSIFVFVYNGSYALQYCKGNSVEKYYIIGDCDLNETIDINDATYLQRALIGLGEEIELDEIADVNRDSNTNIRDVTLIQMFVAQLINDFEELD